MIDTAVNQESAASLEVTATVSCYGIAPSNAIIEELDATSCRFRTVVSFDAGAPVDLATEVWGEPAMLRGTVVKRTVQSPRFTYQIRLDRMPADSARELADEINERQRRATVEKNVEAIANIPTTERLIRSSVRVPTDFSIVYRTAKSGYKVAEACDVSSGGLLMLCDTELTIGAAMELRFTLPSDVLANYPEETVSIDTEAGTVASLGDRDLRRPFQEMTLGAVVADDHSRGGEIRSYGVRFTSVTEQQTKEIERYTGAVTRGRRR